MNFYTARVHFNYTAVAFFVIFAEDAQFWCARFRRWVKLDAKQRKRMLSMVSLLIGNCTCSECK